jgi:hypothetical protein
MLEDIGKNLTDADELYFASSKQHSMSLDALRLLHIMAEGQEAIDFHQSDCKKPRFRALDPSH